MATVFWPMKANFCHMYFAFLLLNLPVPHPIKQLTALYYAVALLRCTWKSYVQLGDFKTGGIIGLCEDDKSCRAVSRSLLGSCGYGWVKTGKRYKARICEMIGPVN